jgi:hypothetical protein
VFDDLRIDASAGALETFLKPQHLSNLLAVVAAGALLAFRHRSAARVAAVTAWIEIVAFSFFHLIPVEVGPTKPYWGEGMGDALQWFGLLSILGVSAALIRAGRRSPAGVIAPARPGARARRWCWRLAVRLRHALANLVGCTYLCTYLETSKPRTASRVWLPNPRRCRAYEEWAILGSNQ